MFLISLIVKKQEKLDKFAQYAMVASDEAIIDAKLNLDNH